MQKNYYVDKFKLDNNQMQVIINDQNSLIIAGAGAGKTLTILGKVNYLLETKACTPQDILIISFTNASVKDIKKKINSPVNVFTFHKLSTHILKDAKFEYSLCSSDTLRYIIDESIRICLPYEQKIILNFLKLNIPYKNFLKSHAFSSFCNLIETFINLYKTNNLNYNDINKRYTTIEKKLLIIIFKIYQKYCLEKKSTKKLDFDDLITYATFFVNHTNINYKYIIIDEFQDTSLIRLNLIKEIFIKTKAKIIVVGDDWQSIYAFSGCDLNIFLNFKNIFPNVNDIKLTNTYRNSFELIAIASHFVQKNPLQIKKELKSPKRNSTPLVFVPYINKALTLKKLLKHLTKISTDIMILGRNNKDIFEYLDDEIKFDHETVQYNGFAIKYFTVHKSKGLEAEHVIILNCDNSALGFPNKIENNPIIDKLIANNEMKYAEERRLFYVAITRCKENTYLVYNKNNPSIFLKEIKKITKKQLKHINYFKC